MFEKKSALDGLCRRSGLGGGVVVKLVRRADGLHVAGKGGLGTGCTAYVAGDDDGSAALFALAGAQAEIDVRHDDIAAGTVHNLVAQHKILKIIAHAAVAVDGKGALGAGLFGDVAGTDVLSILGGGVQGAGMLLHMVGADDPLAFLGLGALDLERQHKIVRRLNAGIRRAGRDAGLGNGFRCPNCGQPIPAAEYETLKAGITALGSLPGHIGPDDGGNPFAFAEPVGFDLCVKEDTSAYLHSLEPADEPQS